MSGGDLIAKAIRDSIADWRREAEGSRFSAERHDLDAKALEERLAAIRRIADQHRGDAGRAEKAAEDLQEALDAYLATTDLPPSGQA